MQQSVTVTRARHAWPETRGFTIHRPRGIREYTFLRFHGSVQLLLDGQILDTPPGACIFFSTDTPVNCSLCVLSLSPLRDDTMLAH